MARKTRKGMPVRREGLESFRFRSAINFEGDDDRPAIIANKNRSISAPASDDRPAIIANKSRGISAPASYSNSLAKINENEENDASSNEDEEQNNDDDLRRRTYSERGPPRTRASVMMQLKRACSLPVVTNDLVFDDNKGGIDEDIEIEQHGARSTTRLSFVDGASQSEQASSHPRNAGQYTVIAFVNSASGGGMGKKLYNSLQSHLGPDYVIDLHSCRQGNMPEDALIKYAYDPMVRILACGGDGTCGWIFSSLDKVWANVLGSDSSKCRVHESKYNGHLPMAIIPLGTGNDLSRQFNWGGTFSSHMQKKSMISSVQKSTTTCLDRWRCIIMPTNVLEDDEKEFIPKILAEDNYPSEFEEEEEEEDVNSRRETVVLLHSFLDDADTVTSPTGSNRKKQRKKKRLNMSEPSTQIFDGVFCNYFSLGFDATIAYLFHHERETHPEKFTSPTKNKMVYVQKSPYAFKAPKLRERIKVLVNNEKGQLVNLKIPKSARALVLMNIQSYGGGNRLTKAGDAKDGRIEVIFVSNLIRFASTAVPFVHLKVAAQTNNVCIRTKSDMHCQVDGEPWLQGEGVIQVKFHSRNSILEKVNEPSSNCGCMSGAPEVELPLVVGSVE